MSSRYYVSFEANSSNHYQSIDARQVMEGHPPVSHRHEVYITALEYSSADEAIMAVLSETDGVLTWSIVRGKVDEGRVEMELDEIEQGFTCQIVSDDEPRAYA